MVVGRKSINNFIYIFLMAFITVSGQIEYKVVWHIFIIGFFLLALMVNRKHKNRNIAVSVLLFIVIFLFICSCLVSDNGSAAFYNIRSSLYSLCAAGIVYIINCSDQEFWYNKLFNNIRFLNILLLINIVVLFLQTRITGFLIKSSWMAANRYYEDHCAGLFGYNATNVLGLYSVFIMMLNLAYVQVYKEHRKVILLFTFLSQGTMALLSQMNDNMGYYVLVLMFLAIYAAIIVSRYKNLSKKLWKIFKYVILIVAILLIALNLPVLGDYIRSAVFDRIQRMLYWDSFGGASGSSERLAIIKYAFMLDSTWKFGTGVAATQWIQARTFGFVHFGINSIGSYILVGGLWFYIAYTLLYSELYYSLVSMMKKEQKIILKLIIVGIVVVFTLYTTIYNDARTSLMVGLIAAVIRFISDPEEIIKSKEVMIKKVLQ